jgi:hypothetical protein
MMGLTEDGQAIETLPRARPPAGHLHAAQASESGRHPHPRRRRRCQLVGKRPHRTDPLSGNGLQAVATGQSVPRAPPEAEAVLSDLLGARLSRWRCCPLPRTTPHGRDAHTGRWLHLLRYGERRGQHPQRGEHHTGSRRSRQRKSRSRREAPALVGVACREQGNQIRLRTDCLHLVEAVDTTPPRADPSGHRAIGSGGGHGGRGAVALSSQVLTGGVA